MRRRSPIGFRAGCCALAARTAEMARANALDGGGDTDPAELGGVLADHGGVP